MLTRIGTQEGSRLSPIVPTDGLSARPANEVPDLVPLPDEKNPLAGQRYFDPMVNGLISDEQSEDSGYYENALNYGSDTPGMLGKSSDPMLQALQGKYEGEQDERRIASRNENKYASGKLAEDSRMGVAEKRNEVFKNEVSNYEQQLQYRFKRQAVYNQWQSAREAGKMSLFNKLFSGAASAVGTALGKI